MTRTKRYCCLLLSALLLLCSSCQIPTDDPSSSLIPGGESSAIVSEKPDTLQQTASDAYLYAFPLVLNQVLREYLTNTETVGSGKAPYNAFYHFPTPVKEETWGLIQPNSDTLQSQAVLDLEEEPVILVIPESAYSVLLSFYDSWGDLVCSIQSAGSYLLCGTNRTDSDTLSGAKEIRFTDNRLICTMKIICDTRDKKELKAVNAFQDQIQLRPLSLPENEKPVGQYDAEKRFQPSKRLLQMSIQEYFNCYNTLIAICPKKNSNGAFEKKLADFGIGAGYTFKTDGFSLTDRLFLENLSITVFDDLSQWEKEQNTGRQGWQWENRQTEQREIRQIALDALYSAFDPGIAQLMTAATAQDSSGADLISGEYKITVPVSALPENALWSISLYTSDGRPVLQKQRYQLFSDECQPDQNGQVTILLTENPTPENETDLVVPKGAFRLVFRLYQTGLDSTEAVPLPTVTQITYEWQLGDTAIRPGR